MKLQQYLHCLSMMVASQKGRKISSAVVARVQTLQPASVNPNNAQYSLASQYNKALNRTRKIRRAR